jgi:hypothetical protein
LQVAEVLTLTQVLLEEVAEVVQEVFFLQLRNL